MKKLVALLCLVLLGSTMMAQRVLKGTVTLAEDSSPLPGVTIIEKGTTNGTFTDQDGKYSLAVTTEEAVLVYKFMGFKTIELAGGGDIQMEEDVVQLETEVITALGVSREKKSLGYSVQTVGGDDLLKSRDANVINNLSGRVAGVNVVGSSGNVGASSRITIRGNASITGANQPLFVVNGVPVDNGTNNTTNGGENVDYGNVMADINPEDIAEITVLKGPNAAALYGSRGMNGVILITTKKGNESGVKKGLGITYSMDAGFSRPFRLPNYQNKFGQGSANEFGYYDGDFGGAWDGYDESWGPSFDSAINGADSVDNDLDGLIDEPGEGDNLPQHTGTWGVHDNDGFDNNYDGVVDEPGEEGYSAEPWVAQPDNIQSLFQTGVTLTNSIALTSRKDNSYARFSYTNMRQTGMIPNSDLMRHSFDVSMGGSLGPKLSMDGNVKYIRTTSKNRPGVGYAGDNVLQQSIWFGRQVDWRDLKENWETQDHWGNNYNWNHSYQNNPYYTLYNNVKPMNRDRIMGTYSIGYKFTDWLQAKVRAGTDFYRENRRRIFTIGTADHPNGGMDEDLINLSESNFDYLITANKKFAEKVDISATFGGNYRIWNRKITQMEIPGFVVPGTYNASNSSSSVNVTDRNLREQIASLYGMASIGYGGFIYLDLTARNDWSSTLPTANNSYFYPSATLGFILSEAVKMPEVFDLVKIRGGWAEVGNDGSAYQTASFYSTLNPWAGDPTFIVPGVLNAPDLRPERTSSLEAGLELVMFKNRFSADFTYYNALTRDLITQVDVAPSTGATATVVNAGKIRNSGYELMVTGTPVRTKDFEWTIGVNWAKNQSKVVELYGETEAIRLGRYWSMDLEAKVGEPFGTFRGNRALYDDNGQLILDGGLPQIDPNSADYSLGTITPDWTMGLSNTVRWKGLSLYALIDIRKGSDLFSVTYMFGRYAGVLEESLEGRNTADEIQNGYVYDGVMYDPEQLANGDSVLVPNTVPMDAETWNAFYYQSLGGHDRNIFDGTFVKLREVSLSYKLPSSLFAKSKFGGLEIGVYGRNLALLKTNVPHVDPESAFGSQLGVQGFEFGALPSARTFGFNLRANF